MVKSELAKVFKAMTLDMSSKFPKNDIASRICYTGQPVLISKEEAVLRIALGSDSLREYIEDGPSTLQQDFTIIEKLSFLGERFNDL